MVSVLVVEQVQANAGALVDGVADGAGALDGALDPCGQGGALLGGVREEKSATSWTSKSV